MTIPRASARLGRTVLRRAAAQNRSQAWRQVGRRHYASEGHGGKSSSELPWIIGSVGFTVPAAVWLYGQGPKTGESHHAEDIHEQPESDSQEMKEAADDAHEAKSEDEEESTEEPKEKQGEDAGSDSDDSKQGSSDEGSDDSGDDKAGDDEGDKQKGGDDEDDKQKGGDDKGGDEQKTDDQGRKLSEDGYELPGPNAPGQINWSSSSKKGPGEGQKGTRKPTEKKAEKDSHSDHSGAQNPYLDDDEKSKKGEGVKETAKIHGTVNSRRDARGDGKPNE